MILPPPRSTRTDTLFPYTTLFRSGAQVEAALPARNPVGVGLHQQFDRFQEELFGQDRSEEHTSELQSLMRISYAVFCLKKKTSFFSSFNDTTIIYYNHIQRIY